MSTPKQNVLKKKPKPTGKPKKDERDTSRERSKSKKEDISNVKRVNTKPTIKPSNGPVKNIGSVKTSSQTTTKSKTTVKQTESTGSSRIVKTQYFPNNKKLYSNALTPESKEKIRNQLQPKPADKPKVEKDHKVTKKTENVSTIKSKLQPKPVDKTKVERDHKVSKKTENLPAVKTLVDSIERPRTATLRKGSVVTENIAGPDIPNTHVSSNTPINATDSPKQASEDDYEDDFESYASDFEEYHSTDTSNYSIQTSNGIISTSNSEDESAHLQDTTAKRIGSAEEEKKLDSGNFDLPDEKHKPILDNIKENEEHTNILASLSDEGFEETSLQFVNFLGAKKKKQREKPNHIKNKRGEDLLGMIRLDTQNYTLAKMSPVSYEEFIVTFGSKNAVQISSQTGDDAIEGDTQTDDIEITNKWTQFPSKFTKLKENNNTYLNVYKMESLGVGEDKPIEVDVELKYSDHNLKEFCKNTGEVMLTFLQELRGNVLKEIEISDRKCSFSNGQIVLNLKILEGRKVLNIFFDDNGMKMLTIHEPINRELDENALKCICCVWNMNNLSNPEEILGTFGVIYCSCFSASNSKYILGGLEDGTITVWDLFNSSINYLFDSEKQLSLKSPNYTTPVDMEFGSKIISMCSNYVSEYEMSETIENKWIQVLSLDEIGNFTIWGFIPKLKSDNIVKADHKYLVKNSVVSLTAAHPDLLDLQCIDMCNNYDGQVFVTTNYGYILHYFQNGTKANPKRYFSGSFSKSKAIDICPHSKDYFLVGYANGNIALYSKYFEKPVMTLLNQEVEIDCIQYSKNKPLLFYTKDASDTVSVWDFSFSELLPVDNIKFEEGIKRIKLSPAQVKRSNTRSYMVVVTEKDDIILHVLNKEHGQQITEDYQTELKKFNSYVKRL